VEIELPMDAHAVWLRRIILVQSVYYLTTALWPLVSIESFMRLTGPKTDLWLVKTVAVLILAIAITLFVGARGTSVSKETCTLALLASAGLAIIDTHYSLSGAISPIYLVDVLPEIAFAIAAFALWPRPSVVIP
jgi:hypothetical protein